MSDVFDPNTTRRTLEQALSDIPGSRENAKRTIVDNTNKIKQINEDYEGLVETLWNNMERSFDNTNEILDQITEINRNPISSAFKGLFDENYSMVYQESRLREENARLQQLRIKGAKINEVVGTMTQAAATEMANATTLYAFDRDGFLDAARMAELGFQIDDRIRQNVIRAAQDAPLSKLESWVKGDTDNLPKELQSLSDTSRQGILEIALLERRAKHANVSMAQASAIIQADTADRTMRAALFREYDSDRLAGMLENKVEMPETFTEEDVRAELQRREAQEVSLKSAKLAYRQGEHEFGDHQKAEYLSRSTFEELKDLAKEAEASGAIEVNGLQFRYQDIITAAAQKEQWLKEQKKKRDQELIERAAVGAGEEAIATGLEAILLEGNPGISTQNMSNQDMIAMLPPELRKVVAPLYQDAQMAAVLQNPEIINDRIAKTQEAIDAYQEQIIERTAEPQRGAKQEYMETGGRVRDIGNTVNALSDMGKNQHLLDQSDLYGPAFRNFAKEYSKLVDAKNTQFQLSGGEGEDAFQTLQTVTKLDNSTAVSRAMQTSGAREITVDNAMEKSLARAIHEINQETAIRPDGTGGGLLDGLANPRTGRLADGFYTFDENGNRSLSYGQISDVLGAYTVKARREGVLDQSTSIHDMVSTKLRKLLPAFAQSQRSFEEEVFHNMAFPNEGWNQATNIRIAEINAREADSVNAVIKQQGTLEKEEKFIEAAGLRLGLDENQLQRYKKVNRRSEPNAFQRLIDSVLGGE